MLAPQKSTGQELSEKELFELSYDSLWTLVDIYWKSNVPYATKAAFVYLKKAKTENDLNEIKLAYRSCAWATEGRTSQAFADTVISMCQNDRDYSGVSEGHFIKGAKYYLESKPKSALTNLILSYNNAKKADKPLKMANALDLIAGIKSEYGEPSEALELQRKALRILEKNKNRIDRFDMYLLSMTDGMARKFTRLRKLDSARYYNEKARNILPVSSSSPEENRRDYIRSQVLDANINYYDNNLVKARDTLLKYRYSETGYSEADDLYYLGAIAGKLEGSEKKRYYFEQLDSVLSAIGYPLLDHIEEVYPFMVEQAIENNEKDKVAIYLKRLKYYDSLRLATERFTEEFTLQELDLPFQEQEKANYQFEILRKTKWLYAALIFSVLALTGLLFFYLRYRRIKSRFQQIMEAEIVPIVEREEIAFQKDLNLKIDPEVIRGVLTGLTQWEKDLGFLDKEIDQNGLAKALGTNSTYLSRIINSHKKQSFSSYLKDLRVTYAINYIKAHPDEIASKSLVQWAEEFGFNSLDVFVRAFKSKAEITPAVFFRRLKKGNL